MLNLYYCNGIVLVFNCIVLKYLFQLSGIGILDVFLSFLLDDTMVSLFFNISKRSD